MIIFSSLRSIRVLPRAQCFSLSDATIVRVNVVSSSFYRMVAFVSRNYELKKMVDQDHCAYIQKMEVTFRHLCDEDNVLTVFMADCRVFHGHPGMQKFLVPLAYVLRVDIEFSLRREGFTNRTSLTSLTSYRLMKVILSIIYVFQKFFDTFGDLEFLEGNTYKSMSTLGE